MATITAAKAGNWSAPDTWVGGVLPGVTDTAGTGGYVVTVDQDINVAVLTNATNGKFVVSGTRTLTVGAFVATAYNVLDIANPAGTTVTLNAGSIVGPNSSVNTVLVSGGGTVVISVSGDVVGPNSAWGESTAIYVYGAASVTVTAANIRGGIAAAPHGPGIAVSAAASLTVSATTIGGSNSMGIKISSPGAVVDLLRSQLVASNSAPAILATVDCAIRAQGALISSSNNRFPIFAPKFMVGHGEQIAWTIKDDRNAPLGGADVVMTNYVANSPAPENVRAGVHYGPSGQLVGTMAVPAREAVSLGTPVDATTGSAALTPEALWDYSIDGVLAKNRLLATATPASVGAQLEAAMTHD